jgi:PadR family transcriptional regulator, regulatory protein PadR
VASSDPRIPGYPHTTLFFVRGNKWSENHGSCEHSGFFGSLPVVFQKEVRHDDSCGKPKERSMTEEADVLQGTLALMALKTLDVLGPLHGYGIARRIEQISGDLLAVNQGTLYPVLLKLEQEGAISSEWGASENNRQARFYRLTQSGRKLLETETRDWEQTAAIIARFFAVKAEDLT